MLPLHTAVLSNARQRPSQHENARIRRPYAPVDDKVVVLVDDGDVRRPGAVRSIKGAASIHVSLWYPNSFVQPKDALVESVNEVLTRDRLPVRRDLLENLEEGTTS